MPSPPAGAAARRRRIVVLDADAALVELLREWLAEHADVVAAPVGDGALAAAPGDLLVIDVAFPRRVARDGFRRLAEVHPATPVIALSPTFLPGVACDGAVARRLGVAAVLPKPVPRAALVAAVRRLLDAAGGAAAEAPR